MENYYNPAYIEEKIQYFWQENQTFKTKENLSKEKFYCLCMFPYPSGQLHMGHVRNYSLGDVIARYQRMLGKNVLQPIGWDAFGLPAENAAIKHGVHPADWTYSNIAYMRTQFKRMGFGYDWSREITTCEADYYRWEQWLFIQMFKKGLVYKKNAVVNWDPVDRTVLANEQVIDGRGWRSGALVERREIAQWFLKITDYAEELLTGLDKLIDWPDQVRAMQRNWIGRSEGVNVDFKVLNQPSQLTIFTTRPDTLFGVTYIAIAPQHPLAIKAAQNHPELSAFLKECEHIQVAEAALATLPPKGVNTHFKAIHPITQQELPIWVANFVLADYGSGAVMAVPAHDQRDFEFAKQYNLPLQVVIAGNDKISSDLQKAAFTQPGTLINSREFDGLDSEQAKEDITKYLEQHKLGKKALHYRLRDWGISRQRYWGTPIPIIHCQTCGPLPVPEDSLPVLLPMEVNINTQGSPLRSIVSFVEIECPHCGQLAKRETDTFDTFMESSWYYARFACSNQSHTMLDSRANYWTPVDHYIGGIEHAVMHLLYARFIHKVLRDEGLVNSDEPFTRLLTQGMVLKNGHKMSKSKGNTVDPQALIEQYGADTVRLFIIFAAPPEQSLEWSDSGVEGAHRFLKRLWSFAFENSWLKTIHNNKSFAVDSQDWLPVHKTYRRELHQILSQSLYDFERLQFNTVVSGCMKMLNLLQKIVQEANTEKMPLAIELDKNSATVDYSFTPYQAIIEEGFSILLRLLSPITPHITHYLWSECGYENTIIEAKWPKVINEALKAEEVEMVVQINGKLREKITVPTDMNEESIKKLVLEKESIQKLLSGKPYEKIIIVPNRLVNIVVRM